MVTIDTAALAGRGIVAPETKRNRTVEEFRLIKRMVLSQRSDIRELPGNTILVTSALPAEGKTTTAVNLAMSIAAEEAQVGRAQALTPITNAHLVCRLLLDTKKSKIT